MNTYVALGSLSSISLSLGAARVLASALILLLLLLCATTKHGEHGGRDDGLLLGRLLLSGLLLGGLLNSSGLKDIRQQPIMTTTRSATVAHTSYQVKPNIPCPRLDSSAGVSRPHTSVVSGLVSATLGSVGSTADILTGFKGRNVGRSESLFGAKRHTLASPP